MRRIVRCLRCSGIYSGGVLRRAGMAGIAVMTA